MPKVTYIEFNGKQHEVNVENGLSIMEGAVQNGVPGIDADCGGACACATCHVYVKEDWLEKVSEKSEMEEAMLSLSPDRKLNSRLACQIPITDELDGLEVSMPEFQF